MARRRSVRNPALIARATAVALAVTVSAVACDGGTDRNANGDSANELFFQPAADAGPDPFTDSTVSRPPAQPSPPPATSPPPTTPPPTELATYRSMAGSTAGLYGGSRDTASCDVEKQIRLLTQQQDKRRAFAGALGISESGLPPYLRGLTSVVLRADTRVTNHGFVNDRASEFQSVLQTGTAVLLDDKGLPRVRCASGSPLASPAPLEGDASYTGPAWDGYHPAQTVVVTPAPQPLTDIVIVDTPNNIWIERPVGGGKNGENGENGKNGKDRVLRKPPGPDPHISPTTPSPDQKKPSSDTEPPSAPANLRGKATGPATAHLTWDEATDDVGVTGYQVIQQGTATPIHELGQNAREADVSSLEVGISYTFTVKAIDEAGNVSEASNEVEIIPKTSPRPSPSPPTIVPPPVVTSPTPLPDDLRQPRHGEPGHG
ncbi:fibronectin type III domain-containing protein [Streptomyces gobiensis]|uniref:fibronectin type III domain-containing protein n=1 Tax=Streptomyces gobiensis TaxID=2875706 RepID=UPI001E2FEDAC|nr:fibronectin type III domain-containing protein [Streptomyces gobiensis]UGY91793.1 fibronectin type III domain-containing protein [Streptomyces gobiensis]